MSLLVILALAGVFVVALSALAVVLKLYYRRLPEGQALVIFGTAGARVRLDGGGLVLPGVDRAEAIDLTTTPVVIERRGREGLICKDSIRAEVRLVFFVRVEPTAEGVLEVAKSVGCARAGDPEALEQLFQARFVEQAKQVAAACSFRQLFADRRRFKDDLLTGIGPDLGGFIMENVDIDHLARPRVEDLDPQNMLDAAAIEAIKRSG